MNFSERNGHVQRRKFLQLNDVDDNLRIALWNVLLEVPFSKIRTDTITGRAYINNAANSEVGYFCRQLFSRLYKLPLDQLPSEWHDARTEIRRRFFGREWHECYSTMEYAAQMFSDYEAYYALFEGKCNEALQREQSGYRLASKKIIPISSDRELDEVLMASELSNPAGDHIVLAVSLMADRESPDYKNSVKESISAVESLVRELSGIKHNSISKHFRQLKGMLELPDGLTEGFNRIYGWSSDDAGIRHGASESNTTAIEFEDAKFVLVTCSAFLNYVLDKKRIKESG